VKLINEVGTGQRLQETGTGLLWLMGIISPGFVSLVCVERVAHCGTNLSPVSLEVC
jgi:hypothetical protein